MAKKGAKKAAPKKTSNAHKASENGLEKESPSKASKRESPAAVEDSSPKRRKTAPSEAEPAKLRVRAKPLREKSVGKPEKAKAKSNKAKSKSPSKKNVDYEVEKIIEVREKKKGKREYLVRWKGYDSGDDSWEPEKNLKCPNLLEEFNQAKVEDATADAE